MVRTLSYGTRSELCISRGLRTGQSCLSILADSHSARWGSLTAIRLSMCLARPILSMATTTANWSRIHFDVRQRCIVKEIDATVSSIPDSRSCNGDGMALSKELIIVRRASRFMSRPSTGSTPTAVSRAARTA